VEGAARVIMGSGGGFVREDFFRVLDLSSIRPLLLERLLFARELSRLMPLLLKLAVIIVEDLLEKLSRFPNPMLGVDDDTLLETDLLRDEDLWDLI
jgi:hypothetical protein